MNKEYLKQKIINIYKTNENIGKTSIELQDFDFLDTAFNDIHEPIKTVKDIEQLFNYVEKDFNNNLILKNKIGLDFLELLNQERKLSNKFLQHI